MTYKVQINLKFEDRDKINFEYLFNGKTKFQDLLEYISSIYSNSNICSCYTFRSNQESNYLSKFYDDIDINKTVYSICKFNKKFDLILFKNKSYCTCDGLIKKYMNQSKLKIINDLKYENEKLQRNNTQNTDEIKFLKDEKKKDKDKIYSLQKENDSQNYKIRDLNNEKQEKEKEINNLNKRIKDSENKYKSELKILEDKKKADEEQILLLKKEKESQNNKIENLNNEKQKKENEINDLNKIIKDNESKYQTEIQRLNDRVKILEAAIDGNIDIVDRLRGHGVNVSTLNPRSNIISIGENNQIIGENRESFDRNQFINFYDVIVNIKSIKDINKGWEIKLNKEKYNKYKDELAIKIGVIVNSNKGKSFLLSRISKIKLPSGTSIRTEGLSIKYPELEGVFKDRRIVLLDSAGLETPVLKEEEEEDNGEKKENIEKEEKSTQEKEGEECKAETETETKIDNGQQIEIQKEIPPKEKKEDIKKIKIFQEKSREKLITEIFLQNYIIYNSNILIIVIGILTYSEQKLLNRIRNEIKRNGINKPLFIIHNLITYTTEQQVEDYIKEFLLKSVTFNLEEGHKITTRTNTRSGKYFYEKNTDPKVFHLLFANEGSEAGKIYNEFTLQFLENNYQMVTDLKSFDVVEAIKERFSKISNDIMENTEKIEFDSNKEIIKLNTPKDIILKKCLIDELGFSNLRSNGFEPAYNYYKKDNKIIVKVEAPGNCTLDSDITFSGEFNIIKIQGEKKKDKEPKDLSQNIINKRELGQFSLSIYLKTDEYLLKDKEPESDFKRGVFILEYDLADKKNKKQILLNTEDEL